MAIQGLNHFCFSVSDLHRSIDFYEQVFSATLLVKGHQTAYFDVNGMWFALNEEKDIPRQEIRASYTHVAFSVAEKELDQLYERLLVAGATVLSGRPRDARDKKSIYFTDPDGHKFEFHTGTREDRLAYYRETKPHMVFPNID
ncbi:metallothiol transferase FosB [Shouchella lonarensis]|uniref:Metallothiol transferase FosB n=1 Tax=Shouchella lonarensis TaxID=1464122 RepID=A0A1G6HF67_9BACI|nr:metallothiol transferase FosB [Shouchella lonarensis]SDB92892.1 metallothiol transferase [Shouchella lonarensis]